MRFFWLRLLPSVFALNCCFSILPTFASDRLAGSEWGVDYNGDVFVQFHDNKNVSGFAGCNRFFGAFQLKANGNIKIGPLGATRMFCGQDVMEVEKRFLEDLNNSHSISRTGTELTFMDQDKGIIVKMRQRDWD
ncbi:MAG: META domain-containing protein [Salaquimonas sp.]